jgi:CHASE1-domain containing sensor protein
MFLRNWLRPPRHLLIAFLIIVLLPSGLLVVSAWRLMQQEAREEHQAQREQMADFVVASLQQRLDTVGTLLRGAPASPPRTSVADDVVLVVVNDWCRQIPNPKARILR